MKSSKNHYKLVTFIGNVCTGKSSVSANIAKNLNAKLIRIPELYKQNPFFYLTLEDMQRWAFASDLWFLAERARLAQEYTNLVEQYHIVVDSGLAMSRVYTHLRLDYGYFTQGEWELYHRCH